MATARLLLLLAYCAVSAMGAATGGMAAHEDYDEQWYEAHIEGVSEWAVEACAHILGVRASNPLDPASRAASDAAALDASHCASFVSEHGGEGFFMEARGRALGASHARAASLCEEVSRILSTHLEEDEEVADLAKKMELRTFCKDQFSLHGEAEYISELKHFYVLGKRRPEPHEEL